ncbi:MAG TPA: trigger factor [Thermotogota bacterium]|nr:trigger factor [Thermotogota bacterium]HPJ89713.1 trigger factor [Thermotogota bacterium]HPR96936.1 trigger factor [Thermotogota bacterium]
MKQELISKDKNLEKLQVVYTKEEFQPFIDSELKKAGQNYQIPGFRKGKAPKNLLKKMLGEESLKAYALEELLKRDIDGLMKEKETIMMPSIEDVQYGEEGDVTVKITVHCKPEIVLPDFADITVEKFIPNEENISEMETERLKQLQDEYAILEPKEGEVEYGNSITLAYAVYNEDGKELYNQDAREYEVFEDDKRDIIVNSLGMKAGEEKEYTKEFSADADGNKSGQDLKYVYKMKVEEVYNRVMPEFNDDFAKEVKEVEGDTIEELKAAIRQEAKEAFDETAKNAIKGQIISGLALDSELEISEETLKEIVDNSIAGMKEEKTYEQELEKFDSEEDFLEEVEKANKDKLTEMYAVQKIFRDAELKVEDEDLKDYIARIAPTWGMTAEQAEGFVMKNASMKPRIEEALVHDKVAEYLMDKCTIVEKELPTKEQEQDAEDQVDQIIAEVERATEAVEKKEAEKED